MKAIMRIAIITTALICMSAVARADVHIRTNVSASIKHALEKPIDIHGRPLRFFDMVKRFYNERDHRPAWTEDCLTLPQAKKLFRAVSEIESEGLMPELYGNTDMFLIMREMRSKLCDNASNDVAALELILTDAFLGIASDMIYGRANDGETGLRSPNKEEAAALITLLQGSVKENRVYAALDDLLEGNSEYNKLKAMLKLYRGISNEKGGFTVIAKGAKLNDKGPHVQAIRNRLALQGYLPPDEAASDVFDSSLERAVMKYQETHGLALDGVVGAGTVKSMNLGIDELIGLIVINMDRLRRMPDDLGRIHIKVNVPDFTLDVVDKGYSVMSMRVVIGSPEWDTPWLNEKMTGIILNPDWHMPKNILIKEILPEIQNDPEYLQKHDMTVLKYNGQKDEQIDISAIDWSAVNEETKILIRQAAGPNNPLGRFKFNMPNPQGIYLHDTPAHAAFQKQIRAFSHGCIRVERPMALAEFLLREKEGWDNDKIKAEAGKGATLTIPLQRPIDVHIFYFTAWVDEAGYLQFRPDIYNRDPLMHDLLGIGGNLPETGAKKP